MSIGDQEHAEQNYYEEPVASEEGFLKLSTPDRRL